MASLYTQAADRKRLAREAMSKLAGNETATSIRAPTQKVRVSEPKENQRLIFSVVRPRGLEPPRVAPLAPQASASTNSATAAYVRT